ncbi:MAG: NADH:ubiquinone oxidoreductase, subunit iron-sulfur binding protein [Myxococcales bacterium]|nr:NADH:ubiquinone oxidoreductase, subunit iron-sulfur binding protein [Myxococcales bacterium]
MATNTTPAAAAPTGVTLTIDGKPVTVPKGTNVLEAARSLGLDISAFCYHPGLSIVAQCRQCLVSIEKNPKLQPSCQQTCGEGMVVHTTDAQSTLARKQQLEFTLLNHPVDCPICDKAGECTLQKLYFEHDNADSRVDVPKVHKEKVVDLGPTIVLDQERCILCSRCIRACDEVAGSHQLEFAHRGDHQVLTTAPGEQLDNPYSLNTVDVCPVGALTAKDFRFTMRAWELEATPSVCNGCATGCNIEIHHKDERAWRLVPRLNPDVNGYWMCDEGRFTYHDLREARLAGATIEGLPAGWDRALSQAAKRLGVFLKDPSQIGIVLSAVACNEDNYALARLAKEWNVGHVFVAAKPPVPARADGKLRVADINPNMAGVTAIAAALGLQATPAYELDRSLPAGLRALVILGDVLPGLETGKLKELEVISLSAHERGPVPAARIALPIADWAEISGTITNHKGLVQRMHAAFPPPGQAIPGWEAVVRLAFATGVKLPWTHAREVFKDMTQSVTAWSELKWAREARPLSLRFAGSRG